MEAWTEQGVKNDMILQAWYEKKAKKNRILKDK